MMESNETGTRWPETPTVVRVRRIYTGFPFASGAEAGYESGMAGFPNAGHRLKARGGATTIL